jgi:hypothetical protein
MKTKIKISGIIRSSALITLSILICAGGACTTTYDSSGRQVQTVDPGAAVAGVAAAGILGYAIGKNNDNNHHSDRNDNYYRSDSRYSRGYRGHHYR